MNLKMPYRPYSQKILEKIHLIDKKTAQLKVDFQALNDLMNSVNQDIWEHNLQTAPNQLHTGYPQNQPFGNQMVNPPAFNMPPMPSLLYLRMQISIIQKNHEGLLTS